MVGPAEGSSTLNLNDTPAQYRPVVQVIDNFARNNKLAAVFKARVGRGRLVVCTLNLSGDFSKKPAAGQFLRSLYAYMASDGFRPSQELTFSAIDKVLAPSDSMLVRLARNRSTSIANSATANHLLRPTRSTAIRTLSGIRDGARTTPRRLITW